MAGLINTINSAVNNGIVTPIPQNPVYPTPSGLPLTTGGTPFGVYAPASQSPVYPTPNGQPINTNIPSNANPVTTTNGGGAGGPTTTPVNATISNPDQRDANGLLINPPGALYDRNTGQPLNQGGASPAGSINSVLNGLNTSGYTPSEQAALDSYNQGLQNNMNANFDPNAVYKQNLSLYQSQIDALNNIYNDQVNQSRIQNAPEYQSRVGSQTAMAARGGLLGSDPGKAMVDNQVNANQKTQSAQEAVFAAQRNDAIAKIYGQVADSVTAAQAAFNAQKAKSTADYIAGIKAAPAQRAAQVSNAAKALIAAGIDPNSLTSDEVQQFADKIGVSPNDIISAVSSAAADQQAAQQKSDKAAADLANTQANTAKTNQDIANWGKMTDAQKATNAVEWYKANNPNQSNADKTSSAISNLSQAFVPKATVPNSGGVPMIDNNGYATPDGWRAGSAIATQDGVSRQDFIKTFGFLVAPGLESSYGLTPAEQKLITGALPTSG